MSTADEIAAFEKSVKARDLRIADVLREAGIDRSMWTRWKSGKTTPRLDNWRAMERAADVLAASAGAAA
ncbi:helix-turn-helix domain-containing protein [Devosia submarina]|uniref:helix-turn-helix domain-containing protein n=1 Tax=Devosia submarina TaxID=1173082 RepID=UPI000D38017B|nr:helix-turn-helix transcriptional regulator [Devosia submarina]